MEMILMNDGTIEYVADFCDFTDLVEKYMGTDARQWMEEFLSDAIEDSGYAEILEKEIVDLKESHRSAMESIRTHSEKLAGLIGEKEPDRKAISRIAGEIGMITWREMNR